MTRIVITIDMGGASMRFVLNLGNGCELYDSAKTHPFATTASIILMKSGRVHKRFKYLRNNRPSRDEAIETATNYIQHMNNEHKIEVKDLRIGNMVWRPINAKEISKGLRKSMQYGKVTNIGPKAWMCDHRVKGIMCEPIPLSDALFTAFGFTTCFIGPYNNIFRRDGYVDTAVEAMGIEINTGMFIVYTPDWILSAYDTRSSSYTNVVHLGRVEYVHQLQNKYYALTEEELIYKPS